MALVSLVDRDRQFFKSAVGLAEPWAGRRETPLTHSFCLYAVASRAPLVVEDAARHPLVCDSPALPELGVAAYAGVPLLTADGHALGTLCVIDHQPRVWTPRELEGLHDLAALGTAEIQRRLAAATTAAPLPAGDPRRSADGLPVMVWASGPDRGWNYVNARWLEFTGRPAAAELGLGWVSVVHPEDRERVAAEYEAALGERRPFTHEWRARRHDGEYRWLLVSGVPRYGEAGEFVGYSGCCADVTDRRALERRLADARRFEAVAQLAGGVAHDFNNILTGIIGHVTFLLEDAPLGPAGREDLEQVRRAADRAALLTRQLLAYGRRQILSPRVLDVSRLVAGMGSSLRRLLGPRVELQVELDPDPEPVLADPGQLEHALLQLATNARDAMPAGGRVVIRTGRAEPDEEFARTRQGMRPGRYVTIEVRDSGVGMDAATAARVFEPFFTTKPPSRGPGLGLATVYGIVKQSGGYIDVASEPGRGTSFVIYLPRSAAPADRPAPAAPRPAEDDPPGDTVLLVEDEEQVRELARRALARAGYTVLAAPDAEAAIALADRHPGEIHLLVTDLALPHATGRELAARLAIHRPTLKVLYISGTADDAVLRHRVLQPETEFLEKPFAPDDLLRQVRRALSRPGAEPGR